MNFQKILVATDFSAASLAAVETGFNLALEGSETMYLLNIIETDASPDHCRDTWPALLDGQHSGRLTASFTLSSSCRKTKDRQ